MKANSVNIAIIFFSFILSGLFLTGCDDDIQLATLRQSAWYQKQVKIVNEPQKIILDGQRSLWIGKITAINNRVISLKPFRKLAGFSNVKNDTLHLWFKDSEAKKLAIGDWVAAQTQRSLKDQYCVQDYRALAQNIIVPQKFSNIYNRILLTAIEHGWHLKVEMLNTDSKKIKISHKVPQKSRFYAMTNSGEFSSERILDGEVFPEDALEIILWDILGIYLKMTPPQNTPGWQEYRDIKNDIMISLRCGYDFAPVAFGKLTGDHNSVNASEMIRFPKILESSSVIATHPSTQARQNQLQEAFDKAEISGKWEIGDMGGMIFYSNCRDFELDMPWLSSDPIKVRGPKSKGFIFSLSPPNKGALALSLWMHGDSCNCPHLYYWKMVKYPGYLVFNKTKNLVWHTWNFEFGHELTNHTAIVQKIIQTLNTLPPWTLPQRNE